MLPTTYRVLSGLPLRVASAASAAVGPQMLAIRVNYAGVNRLDLLQLKGASEILGVEVSGIVQAVGNPTTGRFKPGDRVMALLPGGGYAEYVQIEESLCMPVPQELTLKQAAAIPENWITAFQLTELAGLTKQDTVLIYAGASGVGSALIQFTKALGCPVIIAVCGDPEKEAFTLKLGATHALNRHQLDETKFAQAILTATDGQGVSVVFDCVGGSMFNTNCRATREGARWIFYGCLGGVIAEKAVLGIFLSKHLHLHATTLRSRPLDYRSALVQRFEAAVLPKLAQGQLKVIIDEVFPWDNVAAAHDKMRNNSNKGKLLLEIVPENA